MLRCVCSKWTVLVLTRGLQYYLRHLDRGGWKGVNHPAPSLPHFFEGVDPVFLNLRLGLLLCCVEAESTDENIVVERVGVSV